MPNLSILRFSCSGYLEYRKLFLISYCDRWTRVSRHGIILYTCAAFFGRRSPWRSRFWVSGEFHWPTLRPADQYLCSGCGRQRAADQPLVRPPRRLSYLQRHLEPHRHHVSCSSNLLCTFTVTTHTWGLHLDSVLVILTVIKQSSSSHLPILHLVQLGSWWISRNLRKEGSNEDNKSSGTASLLLLLLITRFTTQIPNSRLEGFMKLLCEN